MEIKLDYIESLKTHIKALEKGYENLIVVLSEDIEIEEETGKVALKEDKLKIFCEGIEKASEALDKQLARIKLKKEELDKILNPEKESKKVKEVKNYDYPLEKHLR